MADGDEPEKSGVNEPENAGDKESSEAPNDEGKTISETVKNISSKSMKQIGKWNNESFLYAFDRQLISFGIRLLLFLPGFALLDGGEWEKIVVERRDAASTKKSETCFTQR